MHPDPTSPVTYVPGRRQWTDGNLGEHERRHVERDASRFARGPQPRERKVARTILANYPIAGLETVAELAARAKVSPPTVVRVCESARASGYPEFQKRWMREVHERLDLPLSSMDVPICVRGQ